MTEQGSGQAMLTSAGLASHLRQIAGEVVRGRIVDDLELRHLLAVIQRCSLILGDFYGTAEIGSLLAAPLPAAFLEELLDGEEGGPHWRGPENIPDQVRAVADKCLYDVGLVGLDVYRGVNLSNLGVQSYRLASDSLRRLAADQSLRRFFHDNRWANLPLREEVRFLDQCADNFRCYAEILRHLRDTGEEEEASDMPPFAVRVGAAGVAPASPTATPPAATPPAATDDAEPDEGDDFGEDDETDRERRLVEMERTLRFAQLDPERLRRELAAVVIDQEGAIEALCDDLALRAAGTANRDRPPGYLFVGPTGVGKNHLIESLIRRLESTWKVEIPTLLLEGPQFTYPSDINDLKGATRGFIRSDEEGMLSEFHQRARQATLSVLIVDEVEKAHPQLTRFFLSILDRGTTTDNRGHILDFTGTLIVFTSNLGYSRIGGDHQPIGYHEETARRVRQAAVHHEARRTLSPEFLNRLRWIEFQSLSRGSIARIFDLEVDRIRLRFRRAQGVTLEVSAAARAALIEAGFSPRYGARHLVAVLEDRLAVPVTRRLLTDRSEPEVPAGFLSYLSEIRSGRRAVSMKQLERRVRDMARGRLPYRSIRVDHDGEQFLYRPEGVGDN